MSSEELAWLASALRQPGYKLPGHDENGEPISGATIRLALDLGLIEPWLPLPGESVPKVCRLTEKGELLAESFLLGGERSLTEVREIAEEFEEEDRYEDAGSGFDRVALDEILDEQPEEDGEEAWWEALPEELTPEDEKLLGVAPRKNTPHQQHIRARKKAATAAKPAAKQPLRRRFTAEERQEALRILREGVQSSGLPSPSRFAMATAKLAGGVSLMAVGFLLGWSIDPPFLRMAEPDRVRIAIDQGAPATVEPGQPAPQSGGAPSVDDILAISPSAGPGTPAAPDSGPLQPPSFAAPIERSSPPAAEPGRSPSELLPPLNDPDLLEKWDRADAAPLVIERIPLDEPRLVAESSRFGVQMAAFNSAEQARAASARLETRHGDLLADLPLEVEKDQVAPLGDVYRIKSGPLPDQGAAERLCTSLRQRGQDCFVVTLPAIAQ
jgi:hypothetical protein